MQLSKKVFSNMWGQFMTEFPWSLLVSIVTTRLNRNRASNNMWNLFTMELHILVNIGTIRIHRNKASNYMWNLFIMDINNVVIIVSTSGVRKITCDIMWNLFIMELGIICDHCGYNAIRKKVFSSMCGQFRKKFPGSILVSIVTTKLNRNRASYNMWNLFTM